MSKQIKEASKLGIRMNETDLDILSYFSAASTRGEVNPSIHKVSVELGVSDATTSRSLRRLKEAELIHVRQRFLPNGGQLENHYLISSKGVSFLKSLKD